MADGLYIDAMELQKGVKGFERLIKEMPDKVSDVLNASADEIASKAKRTAPADRGDLRRGISTTNDKPLEKHITSRAPYSAYVEFGTGKYAAQQVSKYPPDYQTYAAQFKGKTGGNIDEFVLLIAEWVNRKGLAGTYSVKTTKRTGNKNARPIEDLEVAYDIAISILRHGIHPHPFLIPAVIKQQDTIITDLKTLLNNLKVV